METKDAEALGKQMLEAVKSFVARALSPFTERIDDLYLKIAAIPAGQKGDKGDPGESIRGEKGEPGEKGAAGESIKGDTGQPGKDGQDADPLVLRAMVRDEVTQAVAAIPKAQDGKDGAPGRDGADGKDAINIHPDTVALMVREAVDKAVAAMPQVLAADGRDGRDAAQLEPLPGIDESRSYARGTWASHAGGLIRAARATDPVTDGLVKAGWVVMVEGVSALVATQGEDPREISVAAMLTSGTKAISSFVVPMVIDKGVWREGEYDKGDAVSWDGSGWIAQRKTSAKPGPSPEDWRLSTKRGRDGKDGKAAAPPVVREPVRLK